MSLQNQTMFARSETNEIDGLSLVGLKSPIRSGIIAGTKVETEKGWCAVEMLLSGTKVQTYAGLRRVAKVERSYIEPTNPAACPDGLLLVPGGALNNCSAFYVLPGQHLLLETIYAEEIFGDAATLIPGAALEGFRGITRVRPRGLVEVITLRFDEEDVVYGNTGVLFHSPAMATAGGESPQSDFYLTLTKGQSEALLALLETGAVTTDDARAVA